MPSEWQLFTTYNHPIFFSLFIPYPISNIKQLYIYAALFCLEYKVNPRSLNLIECRIYQNLEVLIDNPTGDLIQEYMDKIQNRTELIKIFLEREGR